MEKILENTLLLMILPWIFVWGILCILEKRKQKNEDGNKDEKSYVIQNDNIFFDISEVISVSAFLIFFAILTLDSAIWRVIVDGDIIKYRSFYGITRTYNFNDITKGVYTKKGSLKIYIEGKRIFTFYDNLEFSLFENQMRKRKIPLEYKRKEK